MHMASEKASDSEINLTDFHIGSPIVIFKFSPGHCSNEDLRDPNFRNSSSSMGCVVACKIPEVSGSQSVVPTSSNSKSVRELVRNANL